MMDSLEIREEFVRGISQKKPGSDYGRTGAA